MNKISFKDKLLEVVFGGIILYLTYKLFNIVLYVFSVNVDLLNSGITLNGQNLAIICGLICLFVLLLLVDITIGMIGFALILDVFEIRKS